LFERVLGGPVLCQDIPVWKAIETDSKHREEDEGGEVEEEDEMVILGIILDRDEG
jgi:hypothetical protein